MVEIRWTNRAIDDMLNIADYIGRDSKKYAKLQVDRFFQKVTILETHPQAGKIVPEINRKNLRELLVSDYRIIYKVISKTQIDIITIHHGARLFFG